MTLRLSRRALLTAVCGATLAQACSSPEQTGSGTRLVRPTWSEQVVRRFGVNAHPNFLRSGYRHTEDWLTALAELGVPYFRGLYASELPVTAEAVRIARELGLRWGMLVSTGVDEPLETVRRRIADIAESAADVCLYVEGVNEPNYVRGGGPVPSDWAERTAVQQSTIWEAVREAPALSEVTVLGPSLQAVVATDDDYRRLTALGLPEHFDATGAHVYPGGHQPAYGMADRLSQVRRHWPGHPMWVTETGYTNAIASEEGHLPVPEEVSADYAPAALLEAVDQDYRVVWYELLDDPDPGEPDQIEHHFGLLAAEDGAGPPWRKKPAALALQAFLAELRDPGPAYTPPAVPLRITTDAPDVRWTALGKRDGSVRLYLRRAVDCWDPEAGEPVAVDPARVVVGDGSASREVDVDHRVVSIQV